MNRHLKNKVKFFNEFFYLNSCYCFVLLTELDWIDYKRSWLEIFVSNYWAYTPELLILCFLSYLLVYGDSKNLPFYIRFLIGGLCLSNVFLITVMVCYQTSVQFLFGNFLISDVYVISLKIFFSFIYVFYIWLIWLTRSNNVYSTEHAFTTFLLFLFFILFSFLFLGTFDLFFFYLNLEGLSFIVIMLFLFNFSGQSFSRSALKYFVLNAFASGCILFSIAVMFGLVGSTELGLIQLTLKYLFINQSFPFTFHLFSFFFFTGIFLKLAIFPLCLWLPSIYRESSYELILLFGVIFKSLLFFVLFRICIFTLYTISGIWSWLFFAVGFSTIVVGSVGAYFQVNIKRFLAFTSINHFGYVILSFGLCDVIGFQVSILYFLIYLISSLVLFAILIGTVRVKYTAKEKEVVVVHSVLKISGLNELASYRIYDFKTTVLLTVVLLSFAGVPPTAGFFMKYYLIENILFTAIPYAAGTLLFLSGISLAYYLRVLKIMWLDNHTNIFGDYYCFINSNRFNKILYMFCLILYIFLPFDTEMFYIAYNFVTEGGLSLLYSSGGSNALESISTNIYHFSTSPDEIGNENFIITAFWLIILGVFTLLLVVQKLYTEKLKCEVLQKNKTIVKCHN